MQQLLTLILMVLSMPAWSADDSGSGDANTGILSKISAAIDQVVAYIKGIFESIKKFVDWLGKIFLEVFSALWDMITDAFVWLLEGVFKLAAGLLDGVADGFGFTELKNTFLNIWSQIPPEAVAVMQAIGVPSAFGIVVLGILIRIAMQLIPFVRLGS
ncbi:DUF2523 family protein [Comamonas thiooxydans]|uniref:DUF2523 domain-containing protein n=1 Tax=Comamonas thiooxydans TaxID=363952 RepID=A0A0E3BMW6_9BURK|nr:DUF2523 family protein [Comamonas thiooxydans]KGH04615.1 hypothetical protein P608_24110 [Comamonas thiooxydans]KGH18656.1 hypothetical protein P607_13405 [Comamonas thiooxydans]KGH19618.1 hypothetical protein P606_22860 [Comamonas thiooxydans]